MSAVTLQRRLLPRPACSPRALAPPLRPVVTSRRSLSTSRAAYSAEAVASPSGPSFNSSRKVETIPFHLSPQDARERLDEAGASAFGVGSVFSLLWSRFLRRWGLGGEQSGGAKLVAQKALLIPTWRVDIALKGKGLIGDSQMHLSVAATDASLPGFELSPLHNLTVRSPWDSEPTTFDPSFHPKQLTDTPIAVIPFSVGPLRLLHKIAAIPRITDTERFGVGLDPSSFKSTMFAAYPLYLPIYLGEYELNDQRATVVVFAGSQQKAFAIYPSFIPSPTWLPPGDAIELSVGGSPAEFIPGQPMPSLKELKPRLDTLMTEVLEGSASDPEYKTGKLLDPLPHDWLSSDRVMSYSENAEDNRAYMAAEMAWATADAMARQVEVLDENVRGVIVGRGGVKVAKRDELVEDSQKKLREAKKALAVAKPDWVERIEDQAQKRGQRGLVR